MALGKAVVNITANLAPLKRSLTLARLAINKTFKGLATRALLTLRNTVRKLTTALRTMAKVLTTVVVAGFIGAIKAASDFQTQMQTVNTMLDNKADPIMEEFADTISDMSRKFGESTKNLSAGLFDILSASIDASKATDLLTESLKLAVGGNTDVATTTSALLTIINAYGMEAEDAAEISDKMFASFKRGRFTIEQLASSVGRVASTASTANLSLDELLATISTVTRGGISMEEAVTAISAVLAAFLKPQKEAIKVGKEFGLEISSETLKTIGFVGVVKKLTKATAEQQAAIVPQIRGFKAFARALNDVAGIQTDLTLISEDSAGRTGAAFDKMSDTVGFQSRRVKQQVIGLGRELGKPFLSPLQNALIGLNDKMDALNAFLVESRPKIKAFGEALFEALPESLVKRFERLRLDIKIFGTNEAIRKIIGDALELMVDVLKRGWEASKPTFIAMGEFLGEAIVLGARKSMSAFARNLLPQSNLAITAGPNFAAGTGLVPGSIRENMRPVDNRRSMRNALIPESRMGKVGEIRN